MTASEFGAGLPGTLQARRARRKGHGMSLAVVALAISAVLGGEGRAAPMQAAGDCQIGAQSAGGDITLTISGTTYASVACKQPVDNAGLNQEVSNLNAVWGTSFNYLGKTGAASGEAFGIGFTASAELKKTGAWGFSWANASTSPGGAPARMDLIVGLFGGNNGAAYYFDDVLLPTASGTATGWFEIEFLNKGKKTPDLSHLTMIGGEYSPQTPPPPPVDVPEPAGMTILGTGLLGLIGMARGRRRQTSMAAA